jgi:hypothetical protein
MGLGNQPLPNLERIVMQEVKLTKGYVTLIDDEDLERVRTD